jgi:hypothetical protein
VTNRQSSASGRAICRGLLAITCGLLISCSGVSNEDVSHQITAWCESRYGERFVGNDAATACPSMTYCAIEHPLGASAALADNPRPSDDELRALESYRNCLADQGPVQQVPYDPAST